MLQTRCREAEEGLEEAVFHRDLCICWGKKGYSRGLVSFQFQHELAAVKAEVMLCFTLPEHTDSTVPLSQCF